MKSNSMPVADTAEGSVPDRGAVASNIVDLIGNTPLLDLSELVGRDAVRLYAKAEYFNPGGSVKDRPALFMVRDAEKRGLLGRGQRILDATSGNTGIAYGLLGSALGYGVTLCVPRNASSE